MAINVNTSTETPTVAPKIKKKRLPRYYTLEEYFRREEKALHKHEYHNGYIFRIRAGGTFNHDNLAGKAITFLNLFIEENDLNYFANGSDTKIRIEAYNKAVYPDAVVICEKPEYFEDRKDIIINPLIVVEVLSFSTASFDRTDKFEMYRSIPTFREYVLIHQDNKHISVYTKQENLTWLIRDYEGDEATAILYALHQCPLPLKRLYKGLDLNK